jgi:PIN domain nuclease of toxin-antitoxin system
LEAPEVIVVDTSVVIWLASDPSILSAAATDAIRLARKNGGVGISGISLYELAWLASNQRIILKTSLDAFLTEVEAHFVTLPITASVSRIAVALPSSYPLDPMDRIIGATALDRGIPLVTRDKAIRKAKAMPVIW